MFVILSYVMFGWSLCQLAEYAAHQRRVVGPESNRITPSVPLPVSMALVAPAHLVSQRPLVSQNARLEAYRLYAAMENLFFNLRDNESTDDEVWLDHLPIFRRLDLEVGSLLDEGGSYKSLEYMAIQRIRDEKLRAFCMVV